MKRLTALIVALLIGVTMFAQQALWGNAPVVSPEIHGNNTVTFRFKAPKAVRVQLTGDFLIPCFTSFTEWVAMKKHGFLWAVLHRYWTT